MKILIIQPNHFSKRYWGHQLFRNEIARQHDTILYGKGFGNYNPQLTLPKIINKFYGDSKPDVLMTYFGKNFLDTISNSYDKVNDIFKVHMVIDYMDGNMPNTNNNLKKHKYDLIFAATERAVNKLRENEICERIEWLSFSVDKYVYRNLYMDKTNDVLSSFTTRNTLYPNRDKIHDILQELEIENMFENIRRYSLIEAINRSKIILTSNNYWKALSMRYTETLACGGFLLADKPQDLDKLGYVNGKHLVIYNDLDDLRDKIIYYLDPKNEKEREEIALCGMEHVRLNHNCKLRVKEMIDVIERGMNENTNIKS